jgi:DNA-binding transcriptional LysR family regulator
VKHNYTVDLAPLRVLAAVRELGTVTEAASVLALSPSAVSQQLKRLGRTAGAPMTIRTGRRIALTPAAHELLDRTTPLLDALDQALRSLTTAPAGSLVGRVRLAAFTSALYGGALAAVAALRQSEPGLVIELTGPDPEPAEQALVTGRVDLALVHHWHGQPRLPHPKIDRRHVLDDVADVICRTDDPLATAPSVTARDLGQRTWVATPAGTLCHAWLTSMLAAAGTPPRITAELEDFALHLEYVRAGLGLALVPRLGRRPLPDGLLAVPAADPPKRVVCIAIRRAQRDDPVLAAVADALRAHLVPGQAA